MFVKIEEYNDNKPLILNVDNICAIKFIEHQPHIIMVDKVMFPLDDEIQYNQLCEILTKQV